MEAGYINTAEIEIICDSAPFTMVVMQTSYFDQRRVERERAGGGRAVARPGALGGSPPPSGRSRGDAASCTLTCLDGPQVFVSVTKGEGCSLTPARGAEMVTKGSSESSLDSAGRRARGDGHQLFQGTAEPRRRQGHCVRLCLCPASTPPGALSGAGSRSARGGQTCGFA